MRPIIHFIWAGGYRSMPVFSIDVIKRWQALNPEAQVWLWWAPASISEEAGKYQSAYYGEHFGGLLGGAVLLKDIHQEEVSCREVDYELARLRPNYGASSDLLRYKILDKFGGAYFDSDIVPGGTNLTEVFQQIAEAGEEGKHILYVDPNSQNMKAVGNDAFLCTAGNPVMKRLFETATRHYKLDRCPSDGTPDHMLYEETKVVDFNSPPVKTYYYDDTENYIPDSTLVRTGPSCVRFVNPMDETEEDGEQGSKIRHMRDLTSPLRNTRLWIGMPLMRSISREEISMRIERTISYEGREMGMLRLDDHISNLMEITGVMSESCCAQVFELVGRSGIDLNRLDSVQLSYAYPASIAFVETRGLLGKTYLFPGERACFDVTREWNYYSAPLARVILERPERWLKVLARESAEAIGSKCDAIIAEQAAYRDKIAVFTEHALGSIRVLMEDNQKYPMISEYLVSLGAELGAAKNKFKEVIGYFEHDKRPVLEETLRLVEEREGQIQQFMQDHPFLLPSSAAVRAGAAGSRPEDGQEEDEGGGCCVALGRHLGRLFS